MGQRLNIEIIKNGNTLANCYYHWSAYTDSSYELARKIIYAILDIKEENDVMLAIKLLETTGATMHQSEVAYGKSIGLDLSNMKAPDRNEGLIGISKKYMNETRKWQEHFIQIYLDEERINFQVVWSQDSWDWEEERKEDYKEDVKADDLNTYDINFDDVKFDDIDKFGEFLKEHHEETFKTHINNWKVFGMIY